MTKLKISVCFLLAVFFLFWCPMCNSHAQENIKLLIIESQSEEPYITIREALMRNLMESGYKENKNLQVTYYSIGNSENEFHKIWFEKGEREKKYDAIFANGTIASLYCKKYAFNNPDYKFVFGGVTDPVGLGLIEDFKSPPKANFTGVSYPVHVEMRLKFIKKAMPHRKTWGLIYADMPQSRSYIKWLQDALKKEPFRDLKVVFAKVPFVKGEKGHLIMTRSAEKLVRQLDARVDGFISPNDQMGAQHYFAGMVFQTATKPLVGLGRKDVMGGWGAALSIYPSCKFAGRQIADMLKKVFEGTPIEAIPPEWSKTSVTFDLLKAKRFALEIPQELIDEAGEDIIRSSPNIIKVAGNHAPPYRIYKDNIYYGIYNDVLKEMARRIKFNINFIEVPFARALKMMEFGECDMMLGPNMNGLREKYMVYTSVAFGEETKAFYVRHEAEAINTYADLAGKVIATNIGKLYTKTFDTDLHLKKEATISNESALRKVYFKRNDVAIIPEQEGDYLIKVMGLDLKKCPFLLPGTMSYLTISKKSKFLKLQSRLEKTFQEMLADGTYARILSRYR